MDCFARIQVAGRKKIHTHTLGRQFLFFAMGAPTKVPFYAKDAPTGLFASPVLPPELGGLKTLATCVWHLES